MDEGFERHEKSRRRVLRVHARARELFDVLESIRGSRSWRTADEILRAFPLLPRRRASRPVPDAIADTWLQVDELARRAHRSLEAGRPATEIDESVARMNGLVSGMLQGFEKLLESPTWRLSRVLGAVSRGIRGRRLPPGDRIPDRVAKIAARHVRGPEADGQPPSSLARDTNRVEESGRRFASDTSRPATILVTIHDAYDEVAACLESLARHTSSVPRVLLLDDASPDPRIPGLLAGFASRRPNVEVHRSEGNLGYTRNANRGLRLAEGDVVLLNSDVRVTPGWLRKLRAAAISRTNVASVTALSNAAGAFSIPRREEINDLPPGRTAEEVAGWVEALSDRRLPEAPTGNGFCMYVTRGALDAVGEFDADAFPRGYGEENDFSLRARNAGFVHLVEDSTFVVHAQSASFGEAKAGIVPASRDRIREMYPEYEGLVAKWLSDDPFLSLRRRLARAFETGSLGSDVEPRPPVVLYLLHDGQGGSRFSSEELVRELVPEFRCLVLRARIDRWILVEWSGTEFVDREVFRFPTPWRVEDGPDGPREKALLGICSEYRPELVHVQHLIGSCPEFLELFVRLELPTVFTFHDFYTVCPTIHLIDDRGEYCGGTCTEGPGGCPIPRNWIHDAPPLKHDYVVHWKRRTEDALRQCDAFVTMSSATREVIRRNLPGLRAKPFSLIEHGRDLEDYSRSVPPGPPGRRVVAMGAFGIAKGIRLIEDILAVNRARGGPLEFHFLGVMPDDFDAGKHGAVAHGPYERASLPDRLRAIAPAASLIASITPETYCHTLTESWAAGLPVFATDIGTLRERVLEHGGGWLIDSRRPEDWMDRMCEELADSDGYRAKLEGIARMAFPTCADMARSYRELYATLGVPPGSATAFGSSASSPRDRPRASKS